MLHKIPMFPLSIALLPGEQFPLHVFENRYKKLIKECLQTNATFGIPFGTDDNIGMVGSEVQVKEVMKTFYDGSMDILVQSVGTFNINSYDKHPDKSDYDVAEVEHMQNAQWISQNDSLLKFYLLFRKKYFETDELALDVLDKDLNSIARAVGFSYKQKVRYISLRNQRAKEEMLIRQLEYLLFIHRQEEGREFNMLLN